MKKIFLILILLHVPLNLSSQEQKGMEALKKFQKRMCDVQAMAGNIVWMDTKGRSFSGSFKYMAPNKIYMSFSDPTGRILVSNGTRLWVYDSNSNICGIQNLGRDGSGGIATMVTGYLPVLTSEDKSGYTLKLTSTDRVYTEITLVLDGTFLLKKAVFRNRNGAGMTFTLSGVRTDITLNENIFNYTIPSGAEIVKNTFRLDPVKIDDR